MKNLYAILTMCAMSLFGYGWEGRDSTMYWQVSGTGNTVDDGPNNVYTFLGIAHSDSDIGARIAAYDINGNLVKYLDPIWEDESGVKHIETDFSDMYIGTRDDLPL